MKAFALLWLGEGLRRGEIREGANRAQPLARIVVDALTERRRQQDDDRSRAGANWKGTAEGFVFTTTIGTHIEPRNVNRAFAGALRRSGLEYHSPHSLRHRLDRALGYQAPDS